MIFIQNLQDKLRIKKDTLYKKLYLSPSWIQALMNSASFTALTFTFMKPFAAVFMRAYGKYVTDVINNSNKKCYRNDYKPQTKETSELLLCFL